MDAGNHLDQSNPYYFYYFLKNNNHKILDKAHDSIIIIAWVELAHSPGGYMMRISVELLKNIFSENKNITPHDLQNELEKMRNYDHDEFNFDDDSLEFLMKNLLPQPEELDNFTNKLKINKS